MSDTAFRLGTIEAYLGAISCALFALLIPELKTYFVILSGINFTIATLRSALPLIARVLKSN